MKALVSGANGFVGANLVRELLAAGHRVRAMARATSDLRGLDGLPIEVVYGDVLDMASFTEAAHGCEVLFHAAGVFAYWGVTDKELLRISVDGVRNAVDVAHAAGVRRMVLTSSSVVFGSSRKAFPRDEDCELRDPDPPAYVRAKATQEQVAFERARTLGVDLVAACPTMVVGPHDYRLVPSNAVIVRYLEDPFRATFPGGCNIVHAGDVARGHLILAERGERGGRYLLGSENWEWSLIHRTISELCGVAGPFMTATHTSAYLAAAAMELAAHFTGKPPASTRAQATMVGRYYWYQHAKAAALGYT